MYKYEAQKEDFLRTDDGIRAVVAMHTAALTAIEHADCVQVTRLLNVTIRGVSNFYDKRCAIEFLVESGLLSWHLHDTKNFDRSILAI